MSKNCPLVKLTNAKNYMKLAKEMPSLLDDSKRQLNDVLGLTQAIALLSATEEVKSEVIEKLESGETVTIFRFGQLVKTCILLVNVGI